MNSQSLIGLNHFEDKKGVTVVEAATAQKAVEMVSEILGQFCDSKTAVFLSGFITPKLFEEFAKKENLKAGAVLQIDEFYGEKLHKYSRGVIIKNTGLLNYLDKKNVRFYSIIENGKNLDLNQVVKDYDEALRFVFKYFPKSVGVLTIEKDFQTALIPANSQIVKKMIEDKSSLVSSYEDKGEKITLNFNALSMLDLIVLFVVGQDKRETLSGLFKTPEEDIEKEMERFPAKFYLRPEIAKKTILITDQMF